MNKLIESIDSLDKKQAKQLKRIMESTFDCIRRDFEDNDKEEMFEIVESMIEATKGRIKKLAMEELETNI